MINETEKQVETINLKSGDIVDYLGIRATVQFVRKNGVTIGFWGRGLQEGRFVVRRVSSRFIAKQKG